MAELKKKGEVPLSPKARHQRDTGSGSYNRFNLLAPPSPLPRLGSKRKLEPDPSSGSKSPRLDPNIVFNQLRDVEDNLVVVKSTVAAVMSDGDGVFNIAEGGLGAAVHKLALAVDMLVSNQEKLLSAVVDAAGAGGNNRPPSFATVAKNLLDRRFNQLSHGAFLPSRKMGPGGWTAAQLMMAGLPMTPCPLLIAGRRKFARQSHGQKDQL